jgi:tetratricopeptide (TPR) repeat protein
MTMNDFDKAMRYQQESIEISREIGHRWMTAVGLNNLAYIFLCYFTDYTESIRLYNESLLIFTTIEDQRGIVYTLHDMGVATLEAKHTEQAQYYFLNALDKARQNNSPEMELYVLSSMASVILSSGDMVGANDLCYLVLSHPMSNPAAIKRVNILLGQIEPMLTGPQIQESMQRGQAADLEQVVSNFLSQR